MEDQQEVWDKIAKYWKDYRQHSLECVEGFLKGKKGKILDLGCGTGRNVVKGFEFYGVDFSKDMLKLAKDRGYKKLVQSNAWEIPFPDETFDHAIYMAAIHCIPKKELREKSLQELKRVLKKSGKALISVWDKEQPKFKGMKKDIFVPWGIEEEGKEKKVMRYYHLYKKEEFVKLLSKYFKVTKIGTQKKDAKQNRFSRRNVIVEVQKT